MTWSHSWCWAMPFIFVGPTSYRNLCPAIPLPLSAEHHTVLHIHKKLLAGFLTNLGCSLYNMFSTSLPLGTWLCSVGTHQILVLVPDPKATPAWITFSVTHYTGSTKWGLGMRLIKFGYGKFICYGTGSRHVALATWVKLEGMYKKHQLNKTSGSLYGVQIDCAI